MFTGITIANAATISTAVINLYTGDDTDPVSGDVTVLLRADAADNPTTLTSNTDAQSRTRTSASTSWTTTQADFATTRQAKTTPDFAAVSQELVNRGGWASGNAMLMFFDRQTVANYRTFMSYDFGSLIPEIQITYSTVVPRAFLVTM